MIADKRYSLTADRSRAVVTGHPESSYLLAAVGQTIPDEVVVKYGLPLEAETPEPAITAPVTPDAKAVPPVSTKALNAASDKAVKGQENK